MSYRTSNLPDQVVVDLSNLIEPLTNYEDISDLLSDEQEKKLVEYVRICGKMSYNRISHRYDSWQEADRAHDVYVRPDATRFREKAVISDTRAIADTVLTYLMAAITGRNPMFQFEGLDRNSRKPAAIFERLLHQHMRRTGGEARLAQLFLDEIRYGMAPTKCVWSPDANTNSILNYDPRRVFPDPRVAWGDWENMQFIIFTDHASTNALTRTNQYPKLKKYPALRTTAFKTAAWEIHRWHKEQGRGFVVDPTINDNTTPSFKLGQSRPVDEMWVRLAGYEIGVPSIDQIWLVVTVIDEKVVLRCQLNPYGQQFPCVIGGLFFDRHKTYAQSLYDLLLPLHDLGTWLLRSRIDNVQASLNNLIFADPTQVAINDLIDRNPWGIVRTLPGSKPGDGVFVAQVPDVTRGHWNDIAAIADLKQRVSAASDAQQGMPTSDVRTATEIQRLSQLGSQRLGVLARIMSATTIRPLVRMMVSNIQDALAFNASIKFNQGDTAGILAPDINDGYLDVDIKALQGKIEYLIVDGTLPIEPTRSPDTWINILQVLNQSGLMMEYKAGKMIEEAIRAMGVSDLDQYKISPEEQQQGPTPSQQLAVMEKMRGASVQPNENVQREVQKGNLIPMNQAKR